MSSKNFKNEEGRPIRTQGGFLQIIIIIIIVLLLMKFLGITLSEVFGWFSAFFRWFVSFFRDILK